MNYKIINIIRRTILYPFKIILLPLTVFVVFIISNWEDLDDREYAIKTIKGMYKF